ncbi:MAG: glycosyltransferase, partial [Phenylobacterium zucineum]
MSVELVLPCLDEEASLPSLLARIPPGWQVVVADNGSTGRSRAVAAAGGARVVTEPT